MKLVNYRDKYTEMNGQQNLKKKKSNVSFYYVEPTKAQKVFVG